MEHKRKASGPGAMKSRASYWLGVSEPRSASTLRLIANSLGGRSFSSDLKLAHPSRVSTREASRLIAFTNSTGQLLKWASFPANGGEIASRFESLLASNLRPFYGYF